MAAVLDRATSSRTRCTICGNAIAKGEPRIVDETASGVRDRATRSYAHLPCAIETQRALAYDALVARATPSTIVSEVIAEVSRLDAELADEVRTHRDRRVPITRKTRALDDPRTLELLGQLEHAPDDAGLLAVLGDHLQHLADERGELIALDLARSTEQAALVRRRELSAMLSPPAKGVRFTWGIGFLRTLDIHAAPSSLTEFADLLAHPSCRLLATLRVGVAHRLRITIPRGLLPRSLRTLAVTGWLTADSDLTSAPELARLEVMDLEAPVVHPALTSIAISMPLRSSLLCLDPAALPRVTRLEISHYREPALHADLERLGWFARGARVSLDGRQLGVAPPPDPSEMIWIEHTGKPEWGRGRILREFDGKLEIAFPTGTRTLKADAPFLRRSR